MGAQILWRKNPNKHKPKEWSVIPLDLGGTNVYILQLIPNNNLENKAEEIFINLTYYAQSIFERKLVIPQNPPQGTYEPYFHMGIVRSYQP